MSEHIRPVVEIGSAREGVVETVLGIEEILGGLRELVGTEGAETARRQDAKGVYQVEWTVPDETMGEKTEYTYRRAGTFKEHRAAATVIDVVFYDADGIPVGGKVLAEWKDGRWVKR